MRDKRSKLGTKLEREFGLLDRRYVGLSLTQEAELSFRDVLLDAIVVLRKSTTPEVREWEKCIRPDLLLCSFMATLSQSDAADLVSRARKEINRQNDEWRGLLEAVTDDRELEALEDVLMTLISFDQYQRVPFERSLKRRLEIYHDSLRVVNALERASYLCEMYDATIASVAEAALTIVREKLETVKDVQPVKKKRNRRSR